MSDAPKYSHIEIERRWLVDLSTLELKQRSFREIDDLYVIDSRLRLRRISGPSSEVTFKLCKKYGKRSPLSEPITNLYLTEVEYQRLSALPGLRARKRRYTLDDGALDVYLEPASGLAVFEVEFDDEPSAEAYRPPPFVTREVTSESEFSGAFLAERGTGRSERIP